MVLADPLPPVYILSVVALEKGLIQVKFVELEDNIVVMMHMVAEEHI